MTMEDHGAQIQGIVYRGFLRETEVLCEIDLLECGAGTTPCIECGGTGIWDFGYDGPEICVECKGTRLIWISAS